MNNHTIIRLENIGFVYPEGTALFKNVNCNLMEGGFYVVRGPSGSGKSTLLRLMNRLENPSQGEIYFQDRSFSSVPVHELRRQILYIQQTPVVTDGSVKGNLLLPFSFKNNKDLALPDDDQLKKMLDDFSLDQVSLEKQARNLSVGQQQRLCLIRGLLLSPSVILFDEPTSALDDESSRIVELMAETLCHEKGKTIIMVSHREFVPRLVKPIIIDVREGGIRILP
ncbi:MAG: ATP-binding cassette domain-containing protein [Desulfobacteraceae bacterium]|jgi:putative ABC transport system ATP-binding protein